MRESKMRFEKALGGRLPAAAAFAIFVLLVAACAPSCFAQPPVPETFASPEEASQALFAAVKNDDEQVLMQILGAGKELVSLEDKGQDKQEREKFVTKYEEMHRIVREPDGTAVLYVGAENWPFPVPLVSRNGTWHFDPKTGKKEVLSRRVGGNEIQAIGACHALVEANRQSKTNPGGAPADDPISTLQANASQESSGNQQTEPLLLRGYYFRILTGPKTNEAGEAESGVFGSKTGFAIVAYPVEYRKSGVMTFIVNEDGVVYQKDLGPNTAKLAKTMTTFKPSPTWRPAQ
jgi:hypothetical protein